MQECHDSGVLWAEAIMMEPRPQRKGKVADALKNCDNDPAIFTATARIFWTDRKLDKARNWFGKAIKHDPDFGDAWAWWYKFELAQGTPDQLALVEEKCITADPKHGEVWQKVAKLPQNYFIRGKELLKLVAEKLD